MFVFDIMIMMIVYVIYWSIFKKKMNYMFLFNFIWLFGILLSRFGLYGINIPSNKTYSYLYLMILIFNVSSFFFLNFNIKKKVKEPINKQDTNQSVSKNDQEKIIYKPNGIIYIFVLIAFFVLLLKLPNSIKLYFSGGFYAMRLYYLSEGTIFITGFINSIIVSSFYLSLISIFNGYNKIYKKYNIIILLIDFMNIIMYIIATGGRFLVFVCMFAIPIAIHIHSNGKIKNIINKYKKQIIFIFVLVIIIAFITSQRVLSGLNLFGNMYVYFYGSINMFDVLLKSNVIQEHLNGSLMFSGLTMPFILFLNKLFGLNITVPMAKLNSLTTPFVWISPNIHINNNCTFLFGALLDLGVVGIFIYTIFWAKILQVFHKRFTNKKDIYNETMYIYIITSSIFMLFEWVPDKVNVVYGLIFIYLFNKISKIKFIVRK